MDNFTASVSDQLKSQDCCSSLSTSSQKKLNNLREEHSVEIRSLKRREMLTRCRMEPSILQLELPLPSLASSSLSFLCQQSEVSSQSQASTLPEGMQDLQKYLDMTDPDDFLSFRVELLPFPVNSSSISERLINVRVLIQAIQHAKSLIFFTLATNELFKYFQDDYKEDPSFYSPMEDIYAFIDEINTSQLFSLIKRAMLSSSPSSPLPFSCMGACLKIICAVSRGQESQCRAIVEQGFLQILLDSFTFLKTMTTELSQQYCLTIVISTIGNLVATNLQWRVFFMQNNFHNELSAVLHAIPKTQDLMLLHNRIVWCLNNLSRDFLSSLVNMKPMLELATPELQQALSIAIPKFDLTCLNGLFATFNAYDQQEIRTDVSWVFSSIISLVIEQQNSKQQPLLSDELRMNIENQIIKCITSGFTEILRFALIERDVTSVIPLLRSLRLIFIQPAALAKEVLLNSAWETVTSGIQSLLISKMKMLKMEAIKTVNAVIYAAPNEPPNFLKKRLLDVYLPSLLSLLFMHPQEPLINEEVLKILAECFDAIEDKDVDEITFSPSYNFVYFCARILSHSQARPHTIAAMLTVIHKLLAFYARHADEKKRSIVLHGFNASGLIGKVEDLQLYKHTAIFESACLIIQLFNDIQDNYKEDNTDQIVTEEEYISSTTQLSSLPTFPPTQNLTAFSSATTSSSSIKNAEKLLEFEKRHNHQKI